MNKKLIALFTGLSLSALAVGAVSLYHQNSNDFVKASADDKNYSFTSLLGLDYDSEGSYYYYAGNISLGGDKYIFAEVEYDYCVYSGTGLSFTNGGEDYGGWGATLTIRLDIKGVTSFSLNGTYTCIEYYDEPIFSMVFNSKLENGTSIETIASNDAVNPLVFNPANPRELTKNKKHSERIEFRFENFSTLNIASIDINYSCETN